MYKVGLRGQHTVPTTKLFINNKMVESQATEWVDLHNPATNEVCLFIHLFFFFFFWLFLAFFNPFFYMINLWSSTSCYIIYLKLFSL